MSSVSSPFPAPRRIITWHPLDDPKGETSAIEERIPVELYPRAGFYTSRIMVQSDFPADPAKVEKYAKDTVSRGFVKKGALNTFVLGPDFAPGHRGRFHWTRSFEYVVITRGSIVLETTSGQRWEVSQDDVAIAAADVHYWHNDTDEWARMVCILSHAHEPVFDDGRTLTEVHPDAFTMPLPED